MSKPSRDAQRQVAKVKKKTLGLSPATLKGNGGNDNRRAFVAQPAPLRKNHRIQHDKKISKLLRAQRARSNRLIRQYFAEVYEGKHTMSEVDLLKRLR